MVSILQANLNHTGSAQDLLLQYVVEQSVDIAILSDPYRAVHDGRSWLVDSDTRRATIWVINENVTVANVIRDPEFVSARLNGVQFFSCYASPNKPFEEFCSFLRRLEDSVRSIAPGVPVLVAGDFNARSTAWGDRVCNIRGEDLSMLFDSLRLVIENVGSTPTFPRGLGSVVDVTAISETSHRQVRQWRVLDQVFNGSDHHYVQYLLDAPRPGGPALNSQGRNRWIVSGQGDIDAISLGFLLQEWTAGDRVCTGSNVNTLAGDIETRITAACDFGLRRKRPLRSGKPPVHWWNGRIADLRHRCVSAKREWSRGKARAGRIRRRAIDLGMVPDELQIENEISRLRNTLREAKHLLKIAIRQSKKACWDDLIRTVDEDPFGKPYKVVLRKLRGPPAVTSLEPQTLRTVVDSLFPFHPARTGPHEETAAGNIDWFSATEVGNALDRTKGKDKAPGPDGISSKILRAVHRIAPNLLLDLFNQCLREGAIPTSWKASRVVLLRKGNKPEGIPSSYRPICLLNDISKILEYLLKTRLEAHIALRGGLSDNQFGFRSGRSTDDAVRHLNDSVTKEVNNRRFCLAVSLDIKNAFNSVRWEDIVSSLVSWEVPWYLLRMSRSYLADRTGSIDGAGNTLDIVITGGVPQGSVVGPLLWNITYNAVLSGELPHGAQLLGFADDTMVLITGESIGVLESRSNEVLDIIARRIIGLGLEIAAEKTEAVLFTSRYKFDTPNVSLLGIQLKIASEMTYLGMVVDRTRLFKAHVRKAADKAEKVSAQLARLMPNIGGPREHRRRLLAAVIHSVLLYGAPTWAHTLEVVPVNARAINRAQRNALLRSICAYRTVSEVATNILASTPPADLLATERAVAYLIRRQPTTSADPANANPVSLRVRTMASWRRRLKTANKGLWTTTLIQDVQRWCDRGHGLMEFHLTQALSGHGCFGSYLRRIGKEESARCHHCEATLDDAQHTLFQCAAWEEQRTRLQRQLNTAVNAENIVNAMLESENNWRAVVAFTGEILKLKELAERERERAGRNLN